MVANRRIILSLVRLLDEFDQEEKNRRIIDIFMVLHHHSCVHQEFNFSKCLAYDRAHRTVSHGELSAIKCLLALVKKILIFSLLFSFSDNSMRVYYGFLEHKTCFV